MRRRPSIMPSSGVSRARERGRSRGVEVVEDAIEHIAQVVWRGVDNGNVPTHRLAGRFHDVSYDEATAGHGFDGCHSVRADLYLVDKDVRTVEKVVHLSPRNDARSQHFNATRSFEPIKHRGDQA